MMYSNAEKNLIAAISPHWYNVIHKTEINPPNLYQILSQEAFINNSSGSEFDALRRVAKACRDCNPYRMTPEFDALCKF